MHHLAVTDVTDGHAVQGKEDGRALRADGREVLILVVADRCASKVVTSKVVRCWS